MDKKEFLRKFSIPEETFNKTGLKWDEMEAIEDNYIKYKKQVEGMCRYIVDNIVKCDKVHSIRFRLKDKEHLIEKIIRKKVEDKKRNITISNYKDEITDIIGIRALHLFKEDWLEIHKYIKEKWNFKERPIAYIRKGDKEDFLNKFEKNGCEKKVHENGYRSVHYLIESKPDKNSYIAEIQVRTIFEEAWSEIDHKIRYPFYKKDKILLNYSLILNRFVGSADEMGSYLKLLRKEVEENERNTEDLRKKINELKINKREKEEIFTGLDTITSYVDFKPISGDVNFITSKIEPLSFTEILNPKFSDLEIKEDK